MDVALINVTPFILAFTIPIFGLRLHKTLLAWGVAGILAALFIFLLRHAVQVAHGSAITYTIQWIPTLKLSLTLYLDSLSLVFALLVTGIGAVIALYAGYYFDTIADLIRFYRLLLIFMGGMLGLLLSGNLLTLFIGWEITSVASFFLISFDGKNPVARRNALQALIVTGGGGLALLAGLSLLGTFAGSFELADLLNQREVLQAHPGYTAAAILIFIGCFSKSAQFPLHFWLPDAMTAPTPASAYLHSATMVKAGIYLLLRLYPVLGDNILWQTTLISVGLTSMIVGGFLALRQTDLKAALAYSTISQLGVLVALIGLPHGEGIVPALLGIVAHALYKATLFLVAGTVEHSTGTRDLRKLGGLYPHMPLLAIIAAVAGLSMAGLPPLLGFVSKESQLESVLHSSMWLVLGIMVIGAALTAAMAVILVWDVFFRAGPYGSVAYIPQQITGASGKRDHADRDMHIHAPGFGLLVGPLVLAALSLVGGLFVNPVLQVLLAPFLDGRTLALWHGFNTPLVLSVMAIAGGVLIFSVRGVWQAVMLPPLPRGSDWYNRTIRGVETVADRLLSSQNGSLRFYLAAIICTVVLFMTASGLTGLRYVIQPIQFASSIDFLQAVLLILTIGATVASVIFKRHVVALLALSLAGYSVGGLFVLEPAPDVALVQFLVETIGTVLVIVMLSKIGANERQQVIQKLWKQPSRGVLRDVFIAGIVGVGVSLFSMAAVLNRPTRDTITLWHIQNAEKLVGSTDIVAAIVTDFRGMDTIIEITVFGMAALGVLTLLSTPEPGRTVQFTAGRLLQRFRANTRNTEDTKGKSVADSAIQSALQSASEAREQAELRAPEMRREVEALLVDQRPSILSTPLTRVVVTLLLPFVFLIAVSHIAYGAGAPGDGFTAGVVSGLGVAVWYVVFGYVDAKRKLRWLHPVRLIGAGISLAILNAAMPLLFNQPFLITTQFKELWLPAGLHLTSTTFFETGIFLTVLGGTALILETIAHPQEVETL